MVDVRKHSDGPRPQTICQVTAQGLARFGEYISVLEMVVQDAKETKETVIRMDERQKQILEILKKLEKDRDAR